MLFIKFYNNNKYNENGGKIRLRYIWSATTQVAQNRNESWIVVIFEILYKKLLNIPKQHTFFC
jgi:hypothetical protein